MSKSTRNPPEDTSDREIVLRRVLAAPRELVFAAWTDPRHVGQWYGPNGFTTTTHEMDVRPGGVWRFIMHGPDGTDYKNRIQYLEVVRPQRLVFDHDDDGETDEKPFRVTVAFDEREGQTELTMRMVCDSPQTRAKFIEFGAVEGGEQTLARLADYLPRLQ
jgi:uncharacterized protein YndB with AHSA1/START domain